MLIIDDDPAFRAWTAGVLRGFGFAVAEAGDGDSALRACVVHCFDVAITDLVMPDKDGIETIREMRRRFPAVRIVAISGGGYASPDLYLDLAKRLGADETLAKPFEPRELVLVLERLTPRAASQG